MFTEIKKPRMYKGVKTWNPFVGCKFNCIYCYPSFRRQAKRRKKWCEKCYNYEPHFHPERLGRIPSAKMIFTCAYGDIAFAKAPIPPERYWSFVEMGLQRKFVTIEPILDFYLKDFVIKLRRLKTEFIYLGYDNHGCKLPEPPLEKTLALIEELEKFTEVRLKTIRRAWWEDDQKEI